jgi:hypothetical protein
MAAWTWTLIAIGIVIVVALVVLAMLARRRTTRLRQTFGSEYDRTVQAKEGRRPAEAELRDRERRRAQYSVKPLPDSTRMRFVVEWQGIQERFVDQPSNSVVAADNLISRVMGARGYPAESFAARVSVISVDQPDIVDEYRQAHRVYHRAQSQQASTEDLRSALLSYRSIFDHLVQTSDPDAATEYGSGIYVEETTPHLAEPTAAPTSPDGAREYARGTAPHTAQPTAAPTPRDGAPRFASGTAHPTTRPTGATEPGDGRARPAEDGSDSYLEDGSAGYAEDAARGTGQPTAARPSRRDS